MNLPSAMRVVIGAAVLAVAVNASTPARAQSPDSEKIGELFKDIKHHAVEAEHDAELLEGFTRSGASWRSHSTHVEQMKAHVNDLARDFETAKTLRTEGSEWQKEAIDQIEPLLKGMADHLSATIRHLNDNQSGTKLQPWREYVKTNREYAYKAENLIRDYVEYGETKSNLEALEKKLEVSTSPSLE